MVGQERVLVRLIKLVDTIPVPPPPAKRGRGHPPLYSERLFLKALVLMIVCHLPTVGALLAVLEEPAMQDVRALLQERGRYPVRRTWERRLARLPATLPAQIACLGQHLVALLKPWAQTGRAAAIDSTALRACGGVWHKKDREAGKVPHTSIDTEAHWTKSGWHGWVYGWKLHLVTTVAAVWIPLAAALTPANVADNEQAPALLAALPADVRFVLGDQHYNDADLQDRCAAQNRVLVTTKRGAYPHHDDGVEVRRLFHELRSRAIENFNGQFKNIFDCRGQVPTRGLMATSRFVLGAVLVYQLALLHRFETGGNLRVGLTPFLKAA
ncbi:MAG: transposase [Acidimicrobiales bacterium]